MLKLGLDVGFRISRQSIIEYSQGSDLHDSDT